MTSDAKVWVDTQLGVSWEIQKEKAWLKLITQLSDTLGVSCHTDTLPDGDRTVPTISLPLNQTQKMVWWFDTRTEGLLKITSGFRPSDPEFEQEDVVVELKWIYDPFGENICFVGANEQGKSELLYLIQEIWPLPIKESPCFSNPDYRPELPWGAGV